MLCLIMWGTWSTMFPGTGARQPKAPLILRLPFPSTFHSLSPVALSGGSPSSSQTMRGLVFMWRLGGEEKKEVLSTSSFSVSSLPQLSATIHSKPTFSLSFSVSKLVKCFFYASYYSQIQLGFGLPNVISTCPSNVFILHLCSLSPFPLFMCSPFAF